MLLSPGAHAQSISGGSVTGYAIDSASGGPLAFANAGLHKKQDSAFVKGIVTDKGGKFELDNIPDGEYYMRISYMGYKGVTTQPFVINAQHKHANLGKITLAETEITLDEVLITGKKDLFNNSIDRKVYNVGQDIMSKSGSASDLLQNIPSVQVDIDGNVSLRGASDVMVMIDGKISPLMGRDRADALQMLDAASIDHIEVITDPSAKYLPDGTAGIINIVLKKNGAPGFNGSATANAGNQGRYNGNIHLNYSPGGFNIFGGYSFRQDERNRNTSNAQRLVDTASVLSFYQQDLSSHNSPISHLIDLGFDADASDAITFGASGHYLYFGFTSDDHAQNIYSDSTGAVTQGYDRNRHDLNEYHKDYGFNVFIQNKLPHDEHKLRLDYTFNGHAEQENNYFTNINWFPPAPTEYDNTVIRPLENTNQLTLDYTDPLDANSKLNLGYAGDFDHSDYNFQVSTFDTSQQLLTPDTGKTSHFIYDETINALYATYERTIGAFGVSGGLRGEESFTNANMASKDTVLTNNYFNLYPSLHLAYKVNESSEFQLNYSRRVHRPRTEDLNPFPEYRDPRNLFAGNPRLLPEYTHSIEFGYSWSNEQFSLIPSIYYRNTSNTFSRLVQTLNDTTAQMTQVNIANEQAAGVELIGSANIGEVFTSHASVNVFTEQIDASNLGYGSSKSIVTWSGALTFSVHVTKQAMVQMNMNYNADRLTPQGEYRPSYIINMGARWEILPNKLSATLAVTDLFHTYRRDLEVNTPALTQSFIDTRDAGIVYLGLTYSFAQPPNKSKNDTIEYDESN
ncbi:MAG TPA: TonB-dependent receptor [Candidatus Kapabacteria bacterium]|nr:TonB-dependent receptor [Candidatus Kapabacteria bacterium]